MFKGFDVQLPSFSASGLQDQRVGLEQEAGLTSIPSRLTLKPNVTNMLVTIL